MKDFATRRPSPSLVISCISLFVALSGTAVALQGANSVKSDDIAAGAVKRGDVANNAINSGKVANDSLTGADIDESGLAFSGGGPAPPTGPAGGDLDGNYPNPNVAALAIGPAKLQNNAIPNDGTGTDGSTKLATNSVGFQELLNGTVRSASILNGEVKADDLGGFTIVEVAVPIAANGGVNVATAPCPAGERVISGGGQPSVFGIEMISSRPQGNAWLYQAENSNPSTPGTINAFAICLAD